MSTGETPSSQDVPLTPNAVDALKNAFVVEGRGGTKRLLVIGATEAVRHVAIPLMRSTQNGGQDRSEQR